ncbi:4802_t:CDS:1 [Acaulospora morrowiae]|uniref:4802_t:CDS:1 n=1 Tax=Acaulospora morrowiae TaxID=94023 RepID=A0A9N8V612_9GLOM|nr:4802_t:CDS:1 [Acaulospora morrowiae]
MSLKEIAEAANIAGKIKKKYSSLFSAEEKEYAIIINKTLIKNHFVRLDSLYAIRLVNYEKDDKGIQVKAVKRFPNLTDFYLKKSEAIKEAKKIKEDPESIRQCVYEYETYEDTVENILLIGITGAGKSTLANTISNTNRFQESEGSVSQTKTFQTENFNVGEINYRVVDTVGFADTGLSYKEITYRLAEAIHIMKNGIKQVYVVIGGFANEDIKTFEYAEAIFGKDIFKYTTIVRTRFEDFENEDRCEEDRNKLKKENEIKNAKFFHWINSCKIIYINTPPVGEKRSEENMRDREKSREKLLNHLKSCKGSFKLNNWDKVCVKINDHMNVIRLNKLNEKTGYKLINELMELQNKLVRKFNNECRSVI